MSNDHTLRRSTLFVTTLTSFMGPFMISAVNVALPAIQSQFSVDAVKLSWIATAFLLAVAVTLVPAGRIADLVGRKKIFTWGLILYTLASLLAGLSPSANALIFYRVLQGSGAALFVTTGMAILTSVFPPAERGRVIGIYVAAVYIGLSVGPFVGGILTHHFGWRSIFMAVVPLGAASVTITLTHLKGEWADARGEAFDYIGSVLYTVSILAIVYGASRLPESMAVYLMAAGLIGLGLFVGQELRTTSPVFEVRLFMQNRLFTFSSLAALIHYSATYAIAFLISLYLQYINGMSAQQAGVVLIAQPVMMALFSPMAGRLSDRIEPRRIASFGMTLTAVGLLLFTFIAAATSIVTIVCILSLLGFGFALFSSPNMNAIMGAVEKKYYGIASGSVATMRLLGQMSSMAIVMVVLAVFIGREPITPANYERFLLSMRVAFSIFTGLCVLGIWFSLLRGKMGGAKQA